LAGSPLTAATSSNGRIGDWSTKNRILASITEQVIAEFLLEWR
jgi:hypothetical protein